MLAVLVAFVLLGRSAAFLAPARPMRSASQVRMSYLENLDGDASKDGVKYLSTIQDAETARKAAMEREHELDGLRTDADSQGLAVGLRVGDGSAPPLRGSCR